MWLVWCHAAVLHLFLANQLVFRAHPLVRRRDGHLLLGGSFLVAEPGVVGKLMQCGFNSAWIESAASGAGGAEELEEQLLSRSLSCFKHHRGRGLGKEGAARMPNALASWRARGAACRVAPPGWEGAGGFGGGDGEAGTRRGSVPPARLCVGDPTSDGFLW